MRRDVGPARAERWRGELPSMTDAEPTPDALRLAAVPGGRVARKLVQEMCLHIVQDLDVDEDGRGWNRGPTGPRPMHPISAALQSCVFRFLALEGTQTLGTRQNWLRGYLFEQLDNGDWTWTDQAERDGWDVRRGMSESTLFRMEDWLAQPSQRPAIVERAKGFLHPRLKRLFPAFGRDTALDRTVVTSYAWQTRAGRKRETAGRNRADPLSETIGDFPDFGHAPSNHPHAWEAKNDRQESWAPRRAGRGMKKERPGRTGELTPDPEGKPSPHKKKLTLGRGVAPLLDVLTMIPIEWATSPLNVSEQRVLEHMILPDVPKLREIGIEVETMALDAGYEGLPTAARLYGEDVSALVSASDGEPDILVEDSVLIEVQAGGEVTRFLGVAAGADAEGKKTPKLRPLPILDWNEDEGWALYGCGGEPSEAELEGLSIEDSLMQRGRGDCGQLHITEGCLEQGVSGMLRLDLSPERPDASVFSGPRLGRQQRVIIAKSEAGSQHQGGRDRTPIPPRNSEPVAQVRRLGRSASERLNGRLKAQYGLAKSRATKHRAAFHIDLANLALMIAALARMEYLKREKDSADLAELRYVARFTTPRIFGRNIVPRRPHLSTQPLGPPG